MKYLLLIVAVAMLGSLSISNGLALADGNTFTSSTSDGYVWQGLSNDYNAVRTAATAQAKDSASTKIIVGQVFIPPSPTQVGYVIERGALYFDTSSIPSSANMILANLSFYATAIEGGAGGTGTAAYDIVIQSGMPTYPSDPLVKSDYNMSKYAGDGGRINISAFAVGVYTNLSLNATGLNWINKNGQTKFFIRSGDDIVGVAPPAGTQDELTFASGDSSHPPLLYLAWNASAPPSITTNAPTYVTVDSAQLNSYLSDDGGETCEVRFLWDDDAPGAPYAHSTAWVDGYLSGDKPFVGIGSLLLCTQHWYIVQARNSQGTTNGSEMSFTTSCDTDAPYNLVALPSACYINLSWATGLGAPRTIVRYQTGGCPETNSSGEIAYNGTKNSFTHEGLLPGTTYHYKAWSWTNGIYSNNSSACVWVTTLAGNCHDGYPTDVESGLSSWFAAPDCTSMENWPGYSIINEIADTMHMPHNTFWFLLAMSIVTIVGLFVFAISHSAVFAVIAASGTVIIAVVFTLIPLWIMFVFIVSAAGLSWKELR